MNTPRGTPRIVDRNGVSETFAGRERDRHAGDPDEDGKPVSVSVGEFQTQLEENARASGIEELVENAGLLEY